MTRNPVVAEILLAGRSLGLHYKSNEGSPDGPWRARCPICRVTSDPEARPLTISGSGFIKCSNGCDDEQIAEALHAAVYRESASHDEPPATTTWAAVNLAAVLAGERIEAPPSMLARTDGRRLIYPARVHGIHAEPEALKSWLALLACKECLNAGLRVGYIDFEDSAASIVARLLAMGVDRDLIAERFVYVRPDEPLTGRAVDDLDTELEPGLSLVIIDGVTEAFSRQGLSPLTTRTLRRGLTCSPDDLCGPALRSCSSIMSSRTRSPAGGLPSAVSTSSPASTSPTA